MGGLLGLHDRFYINEHNRQPRLFFSGLWPLIDAVADSCIAWESNHSLLQKSKIRSQTGAYDLLPLCPREY